MTCAVAGFIGGYMLLALWIRLQFATSGQPFEVVPISEILKLSKGEAARWQVPLSTVFLTSGEYFKAYPLFLAAALLISFMGRRTGPDPTDADLLRGPLLALCAAITAVYLLIHFVFKGGAIGVPGGYIYALPACGVASAYMLDRLSHPRYAPVVCGAGVILLLASVSALLMQSVLAAPGLFWLVLGLIIAASGVLWFRPRFVTSRVAAVVSLLLLPLGSYAAAGNYVAAMRQTRNPAERDLRQGIFQLMGDLKAHAAHKLPGFWYVSDNRAATEIDFSFLQSSRVASTDPGAPGPGALDFAKRELNKNGQLVLIGRNKDEIETALKVLAAEKYPVTPFWGVGGGRAFSFTYALVRYAN